MKAWGSGFGPRVALLFSSAAAGVALLLPLVAFAETRIAEQTQMDASVDQYQQGFYNYAAQSFVASSSGTVLSFAVSPGGCGIAISDGHYTYSFFIPTASVPGGVRYTGPGFPVVAGQRYYLTNGCNAGSGNLNGTTADSYPDGEAGHMGLPGQANTQFVSNQSSGNALLDWAFTVCTSDDCSLTPSTPVPEVCAENCNDNVLFIPGIEASRLYALSLFGENQIWEPNSAFGIDVADLDMSNLATADDVYTKRGEIIDAAYKGIPSYSGYKVYDSFISEMNSLKNSGVINAWVPVAYDWRLDYEDLLTQGREFEDGKIYYRGVNAATTSDSYIIQELKHLAATSKTGKVTIVAHSNGGLLARALMMHPEYATYVDKVILIASPQIGTPQAIGALLHGYNQALPKEFLPVFLSDADSRYLGLSMPMAYNLLPSDSYFRYTSTPVISFDPVTMQDWIQKYGEFIASENQLRAFMTDLSRTKPDKSDTVMPEIANESLYEHAVGVHAAIDNWIPSETTRLITIAGWGDETLSGIEYKKLPKLTCVVRSADGSCAANSVVPVLTFAPQVVIDGDGTVVESSAQWGGNTSPTRYWINLMDMNSSTGAELTHANILEATSTRELIRRLLIGTTSTLPQYVTDFRPTYDYSKPRLHFTLHSPLSLGFVDSSGEYTGARSDTPTASFDVPGVEYRRYGDVQFLSVPENMTGHVVLRGLSSGSFALDVDAVNGNDTTGHTTFAAIASATGTVATFAIDPSQSAIRQGVLAIDYDGDGIVDTTLHAEANHTVIPKQHLTVTAANLTMIEGAAVPALTATLGGFIDGDTETSNDVTGAPYCTTVALSSSSVGVYPITCTVGTLASDTYDFPTFASGALTVIHGWDGFSQPINDVTFSPNLSPSIFKAGSTLPVKFHLKRADGTRVRANTSPLWLSPQKESVLSGGTIETAYPDLATSGSEYRWDETAQQYVYNWSTKGLAAGYWYQIFAQLDDGTIKTVMVGLK